MLAEEYNKLVKNQKKVKPKMKWGELWERYASRYTKPEEKVAIAISHYLHTKHPDLLWWHTPNEGKKGFWQQTLALLLGVRSGVPDIQIPKSRWDYELHISYHGFFCEIKACSERSRETKTKGIVTSTHKPEPSINQKEIMHKLTELGYYCCVVYTLDEFINEWERYCG